MNSNATSPRLHSISRSQTSRAEAQAMADQMLNERFSWLATSPASRSTPESTLYDHAPSDAYKPTSLETPPSLYRPNYTPASSKFSSSTASSWTRSRLRQTEIERDELRQAVLDERAKLSEIRRLADKNQAIADRLKREGNTAATGISATEAKYRMLELERDARAAKAEKRSPKKGMFKAVCSTDLLFLIDTTGSMRRHIDAAKKQVLDIVNDIQNALLNNVDVRIAVVSYKDHGDRDTIGHIDFTKSAERVRAYIGGLTASGGGDVPEDVLGGMREALSLSWKQQTRCMIHIADAPAHGNLLNGCSDDKYPDHGSEPHALTYEPLLKQLIGMNINYTFLRITNKTDLMTSMFYKQYLAAGADGSLLATNPYRDCAREISLSTSLESSTTVQASLQFAEMELGTSYSDIRRLVVSSVTSSATRTAVRMSSHRSSSGWGSDRPRTKLALLKEEETVPEEVVLDTSRPAWDRTDWLDEKLKVEGFSPNTVMQGTVTLDDKMACDENITMSVSELTIRKRSMPFAQGAMRVAFYARTVASENRYVVKSFKLGGKRMAHLVEDMRCQALCKAFALEFNALSNEEQSIDFIATTCFKGRSDTDASENCLSLEPYIRGDYVKYNTNCGWINQKRKDDRFNQIAQAFSHFTFERSKGRSLVCDLQGVGSVLTDPAIHTLDPERFKLTDTNMGEDGFKFFFSTHTCNDICATLGLQSNASMFRPGGVLTFREDWPPLTRTTCCSNKLCGKIIHIWTARRSDDYPGYYWCVDCYPQLRAFTQRWLCVAGDTEHEFDVSTFFYESQGRRAHRKCAAHRGDEELCVDRGMVYGGGASAATSYLYSPSHVTGAAMSSAAEITSMPEVAIPPPYATPPTSSYARALHTSGPPYVYGSPTPLPPAAYGVVATPNNSRKLWAKLKSATKYKKSSSRYSLGL